MPKTTSHYSIAGARRYRLVLAVPLLLLPLALTGCPKKDLPAPNGRISTSERAGETRPLVPGAVAFNGERALEHVRKQIEIGPRVAGSPELAKTRDYILDSLKSSALTARTDNFTAATPRGEKRMVNITAEIPGESKDVIIISSHYDSKLYQDMRFVGANDPGASVGALLELGRVLGASPQKPKLTYWLVFFDGEEATCEGWDECGKPGAPDNTYGSRHYVSRLHETNELARVRALILLDMMGSKDLELGRDTMSTRWLQDIVWRTAQELGYQKYFVERPEGVGGDDHEPFLRAGIASLDLIQLSNYPYWHRADDTIDKVSAESMKIVGEVVLASLPRIAEHAAGKLPSSTPATSPVVPE